MGHILASIRAFIDASCESICIIFGHIIQSLVGLFKLILEGADCSLAIEEKRYWMPL